MRRGKARKGYRRATYPSALRMAKLVDEMPRHSIGIRVESMAERLGITDQSLRRYVKAMEDHFLTDEGEPEFVIEKINSEDWLKRKPRSEEPGKANIYHLISVYLSLEIFKMLGANNIFATQVDEVMADVESKLSSSQREKIKELALKFYTAPYAPKDYTAYDEILNIVLKALVYQNRLKLFRPGKGGKRSEYVVEPYTLLLYKGGLYLVARPVGSDKPLYFAIERLLDCEELKEKFDYPENYHPEQMLDGAFGIFGGEPKTTFKLRFPAELAQYISERKWHKSQKLKTQKDGSLILTMKVFDSEEIRAWIRSFGKNIKVLSPKGIRI